MISFVCYVIGKHSELRVFFDALNADYLVIFESGYEIIVENVNDYLAYCCVRGCEIKPY